MNKRTGYKRNSNEGRSHRSWLVPWLKVPSLRVRTSLIQSAWTCDDRKYRYLLWRAAGVAVRAPAAVGASFALFVQVETQVWSHDGAWKKKKKTWTEGNPSRGVAL